MSHQSFDHVDEIVGLNENDIAEILVVFEPEDLSEKMIYLLLNQTEPFY